MFARVYGHVCAYVGPLRVRGNGGGGVVSAGVGLMRQPHAQLFLCRQSPSRTVNDFSTTSSGVMDNQSGMVEKEEGEEDDEEE